MALYDLGTAKQRLGGHAQSQWGQSLTDDDFSEIGRRVGYGGSGDIDDPMLSQGYGVVDTFAQERGWQRPSGVDTLPRPAEPAGGTPTLGGQPTGGTKTLTGISLPQQRDAGGAPRPSGAVPPSSAESAPPGAVTPDLAAILGLQGGGTINPMQQAAQEALMQLLANSQKGVALSDPEIQPLSDLYRSQRQRGYERDRRGLAERAAATGTQGSGGFDVQAAGALSSANRDTAAYDANLVFNEMQQRRGQLERGIALAAQEGNAQAQRDLQRQLAMVDATLRQQGIDLQTKLGTGDLDLRRLLGLSGLDLSRELGRGDLDLRNRTLGMQGALGRGDLGLRLLQMLMGNDNFYAQLGLNAAQMQALLNQQGLQSLLGGF